MSELPGAEKHSLFWTVVIVLYLVSIALSYHRVYIRHDYPTFMTEEEIPDVLAPVNNVLNNITG